MSDRDQGSVRRDQSNTVASGPVRDTPLHKHAPGVSGVKENTTGWKNLRAELTFLLKFLSDFTEFPIARKMEKKTSLVFYVF